MHNSKKLAKVLKSLLTKQSLFWLVLLSTALSIRMYKIDSLPPVVSHDEIFYLNQARSISISGSDLSGTWNPLSLTPAHSLFAELPGVVMAIGYWILPWWPLVASKLMSVLIGVGLVIILSVLAARLFGRREITQATAIIATFNPWLFQFSRSGFDAAYSLFFYFLGMVIFMTGRSWWRLLALIPLCLGFYQYQGLKVVFLPLIFVLVIYNWLELRKTERKTTASQKLFWGVFLLVSLVVVSIFALRLRHQSASGRLGDFIFSDMNRVQALVNEERQQSLQNPLLSLVSNKYTYLAKEFVSKYAESFNFRLFFIAGEPLRSPFSVWTFGLFYVLDAIFILIGLFVVWSRRELRPSAWLLTSLILIAPLPTAINVRDTWIVFRSSLLIPALVLLGGVGLGYCWSKSHKIMKMILILAYSACVLRFGYEYLARFPIIGTRGPYFAERVVANYIARAPQDRKIIVLSDESRFMFEEIIYFGQLVTPSNLPLLHRALAQEPLSLGRVTVDTACLKPEMFDGQTTVIADAKVVWCDGSQERVKRPFVTTTVPSLIDSGGIFRIYDDTLCPTYNLDRYSHVTRDVMAVEGLPTSVFCEQFIIQEQ